MKQSISTTSHSATVPTASPFVSESGSQNSYRVGASPMLQSSMDLLSLELPVFEEATQTASRFLKVPICTVGLPSGNALMFKAAVGLSHFGLMNPLARTRHLPLDDTLSSYVLQEKRCLVLPAIEGQEPFAQSVLVRDYGICAYLGVPLLTTEGKCIGLLAAMDLESREFSSEAIAFMEILARWSVSEYERFDLSQQLSGSATPAALAEAPSVSENAMLDTVRLTLMSQLTEDMRNPLTTIAGMASMLSREIYGALTPKQREYADIVRSSSQTLLEMANEVLELGGLGTSMQPMHPTAVDFEMLGQYVQKTLTPIAQEKNQEIRITVEPGSRLWKLDKDVVRQLLYHLTFSVIKLSGEGGIIRIHGSEREDCLNIAIWVSHPWLGEGLPSSILAIEDVFNNPKKETEVLSALCQINHQSKQIGRSVPDSQKNLEDSQNEMILSRETLSLLLSQYLIQHHQGTLTLQGNPGSGHRFLIILPSV